MIRRIAFSAFFFLASGCSNGDHYPDAASFRSDVESWGITGRTIAVAYSEFRKRQFACEARSCYRDLGGFPCNQRLRVTFTADSDELINGFDVWTIDGKLPAQCL
jgi:hypothetical protein